MDVVNEPIDPSWWEDVLVTASLAPFEPAELLSLHLEQAAADPTVTGLHELVLGVLAMATSAMLAPEEWDEPFTPAMEFDGKRSVVPADLSPDQVALLARVAPLVHRDDLRARIADVAWFYGDRSDVAMLERSVDAYRSASLTDDVWSSAGKDAWIRALELIVRCRTDGQVRLQEMSEALKSGVLAGQVGDNFRPVDFARVLREHGRIDAAGRTEVRAALFALASGAATNGPSHARLARHLEREALAWLGGTDQEATNAATERIARTYIVEANARVGANSNGGAIAGGLFLEKAIAVLRTIPRSYRAANGLEELIDELRIQLRGSREASLEQMVAFRSDPVDLTEAVSYARKSVSGHADRFDALAAFATLVPPLDEATTRKTAEEMLDGTISHLFGSFTLSSDFRKVAAFPGSDGHVDGAVVWSEMVKVVIHNAQLIGKGVVAPALEVLNVEHRFSRSWLVSLCTDSPTVPEGHEALWGTGLALGLARNHGAAVSVLIPQLEQVVRVMLRRNDVHTLFVDELGVESEKSLNALLDMPETEDIFGPGIVMEIKAMLIVQGGPNLRNDIAHGLLSDRSAWSYSALYMWWFCLRIVMCPVIEMVGAGRAQAAENVVGVASTTNEPENTKEPASGV